MWDVLLDAFLDTLKLSWILFIFYILIELVEQKIAVKMHDKLKSKYSVAVGAGFGIVPQCGFSVLAADLYSKRQITLGALAAVFIATSDEALPILFSSIDQKGVWLKLVMLIVAKLALALAAGYAIDIIIHAIAKKKEKITVATDADKSSEEVGNHSDQEDGGIQLGVADGDGVAIAAVDEKHLHADHLHSHGEEEHSHDIHSHDDGEEAVDIHKGCCGHHIDDGKESNVKKYLVHPLLHTLKILAYILAINIAMGMIVHFIGTDRIADFMSKSGVLQPIIATLVGLIPNCASSVLITKLYLADTISFGSCVGGLIVNAGLGVAYLFKANKNIKENLLITAGLFAFGLTVGIALFYIF